MKKIILSALLFCFFSAVPAWAQDIIPNKSEKPAAKAEEALPALYIEQKEQNIGTVIAGQDIEHIFILENYGESDLLIKAINSGCSCLILDFDSKIAPGGSGEIRLKVNYPPEWAGQQIRRSIFIETNDPQQKSLNLTVIADVKKSR